MGSNHVNNEIMYQPIFKENEIKQEYIPVGCVPSARYRMGGSP